MASSSSERVASVDDVLMVLSAADQGELAEIVELVARLCDTRAAGIALVAGDRCRVPIAHGIAVQTYALDRTFPRDAWGTEAVVVVEDADRTGQRLDVPWVADGVDRARFYASAPITTPTGDMVGRLCVLDREPKALTGLQRRALETMARSVTKLIELRLLRAGRMAATSPESRQTAATLVSHLTAELSHDLRVPLSAIVASTELLEDELAGAANPTVATLLDRVDRAAHRMEQMLEQNMELGSPGIAQSFADVDLDEVARQVVLDSAALLEPIGARVRIHRLPVVCGDVDAMYSVLQNLVMNSVKYARAGVPPRVLIHSRHSGNGWRITVRDNGIGIPEESRVDIFSLFSRAHADVAGHGIGLATVHRIVTEHGGRVGADANPAGGAEIWFELPDARHRVRQ